MIKWFINRKIMQLKKVFQTDDSPGSKEHIYYTDSKEFCIQTNKISIDKKHLKRIDEIELRITNISYNKEYNMLEITLKSKPWFLFTFTTICLIGVLVFILM